MLTPLAEVLPGQSCTIVSMEADRRMGLRLMELGLIPGTSVRVVRLAPMRDPMELELRGYRLSIRHAEAEHVQVEVK